MRLMCAVAIAAACSSACIDIVGSDLGKYVEREEKRFQVSGKPEIHVTTFDGSIEIRPWDKAEVEVIVEKRGASKSAVDEIQVESSQNGQKITLEAKAPRHVGLTLGASRSAKLIVSVPATADVAARSGDGSIDLERVTGRIELHSGDGGIRAREVAGDVTVQTGDGSIAIDGTFSALHARSGDGSVRVHAAAGSAASNDWDITTGDGSVTLELPDNFSCELDAHTGDGGIRLHDFTVSNVTGEVKGNSVRGRVGSGGPTLRVRTGDGSITLKRS